MKTTEPQQLEYIDKQITANTLREASKIELLPVELRMVIERYAKIAEKILKKAQNG
jgi:hypothetical protein